MYVAAPLFEAPATNVPLPVVRAQSPCPVLVLKVMVSVVARGAWVLVWAVTVTGCGLQLTALPELVTE